MLFTYLGPKEEQPAFIEWDLFKSAWAACIKRIYEIDSLECPKCKAQMRIVAFIQDEYSIKDIMRAEGLPDFRAPPAIPKFIDTSQDTYELYSCDSFERLLSAASFSC